MAKSKRYPHAFFRSGSWYHRVKELNEDFTIKYNKKGKKDKIGAMIYDHKS